LKRFESPEKILKTRNDNETAMTPMLEPVGAHMGLLSGRATLLT